MIKFRLIIVLMNSMIWLVCSVPRRKKSETVRTFHNGEAIAVDNLIHIYEWEHQKFYKEAVNNGDYLKWPALDNKNLCIYCKKFLKSSIPARTTDDLFGMQIKSVLHYKKENTGTTAEVIIIQCKFAYKSHRLIYYMTRAPEPNCVYSLKSTGNWKIFILTIINKYCDFEDKQIIDTPLKRKKIDIVCKRHRQTGQPIAILEYLLKFELEHQDLSKREGCNGNCIYIRWQYVIEHQNLNLYCYHYMREIVPSRNRVGVKGTWRTEKLQYQNSNRNMEINVTTVVCKPDGASNIFYHVTRALDTNCVYALVRKGRGINVPLIIIFKHCDFEEPHNHETIKQDYDMSVNNAIPRIVGKEEEYDTLESLPLLSQD